MSNVWKRLQRVGKKAAKFHLKTYSHVLSIVCGPKWQANKVTIIFTHRDRKKVSKAVKWEPSNFSNVYDGTCKWSKNDSLDFDVTLYKGASDEKFEGKEWTVLVEDEDAKGKKRVLASGSLSIDSYASYTLNESEVTMKLKLMSNKIVSAKLKFFLLTQFLKEGKATDDDMVSLQSYASTASSLRRCTQEIQDEILDFDEYNEYELENSKVNLKNTLFQEITNYTNNSEQQKQQEQTAIIEATTTTTPTKKSLEKQLSKISFESLKFGAAKNPFEENDEDDENENTKTNNESKNPFLDSVDSAASSDAENNNPFYSAGNSFSKKFQEELFSNEKRGGEVATSAQPVSNNSNNDDSVTMRNLLDWCRSTTKDYENVNIENFSTSWKDGLAFCAIIHHFRPELIDFKSLSKNDALKNLRIAFNAADSENVSRVIQIADMTQREVPDRLSVMTFVYQLKDYYETFPQAPPKAPVVVAPVVQQQQPPITKIVSSNKPAKVKTINTSFLKSVFDSAGESKNKTSTPIVQASSKVKEPSVMTTPIKASTDNAKSRKQYMNPFDSDDDGESPVADNSKTPAGFIEIKQDGKIVDAISTQSRDEDCSSHSNNSSNTSTMKSKKSATGASNSHHTTSDYKQRARQLIQQTKQSANTSCYDDFNSLTSSSPSTTTSPSHNVQLAKQLIADVKKPTNEFDSLDSTNDSLLLLTNDSTMSLEVKLMKAHESNDVLDKTKTLKSAGDNSLIGDDYINEEMAIIEKEQVELDQKATVLEKSLRKQMKNGDNKKQEDLFIKEWFLLVNKKNALIHRQLELEILHKERDLKKRFDLLNKELQNLMQIDDSKKSEEQRKNEKNLLNELLSLVDQRNQIVDQLDEENRNLESEQEIDNFIKARPVYNGENEQKMCTLQ